MLRESDKKISWWAVSVRRWGRKEMQTTVRSGALVYRTARCAGHDLSKPHLKGTDLRRTETLTKRARWAIN